MKKWLGLAGPLLAFVLIAGCVTGSGQRAGVEFHTWSTLLGSAESRWQGPRSLLYTYVLSGDAAGGSPEVASNRERQNARDALAILLAEIQASQSASTVGGAGLLQHANQFVVPAQHYQGGKLTLAEFNFVKSVAILNRVRMALAPDMRARLDRPGPFLLAMRRPINEFSVAANEMAKPSVLVMLVDMSGAHRKAVPVYLSGFKAAVREGLPDNFTRAPVLRAEIASVALRANEAIPFIAAAYADTGKLLAPGSGGNDGSGGNHH
ncbi:hypothetical protein SAMN05518865_116126 [Duganella sp. CF458]|uniref:hypothetical protein n=1 Tax=Duganella sp. CF458 TaxID=1884368 RepID=UPI0008EC7BDB|nr:hypothetical protein [Duganella sp. CF458]SFG70623.1 hypothetical protein SAMN05518865_116126 [Duganella sp. CF458]